MELRPEYQEILDLVTNSPLRWTGGSLCRAVQLCQELADRPRVQLTDDEIDVLWDAKWITKNVGRHEMSRIIIAAYDTKQLPPVEVPFDYEQWSKGSCQAEQMAKDAARYRWLRENSFSERTTQVSPSFSATERTEFGASHAEEVDRQIDAAMSAQTEAPVAEQMAKDPLQELADQAQELDMGYSDREAFEAKFPVQDSMMFEGKYYKSRLNAYDEDEDTRMERAEYNSKWEGWQAALQSRPQPLQGWVMVPIGPTEKMISAGYTAEHCASTHRTAALVYRAMIEAAQDK